jgi:ribose 5-phosphate isomerase B
MVFIGADHRGFPLKEKLKTRLAQAGVKLEDMGDDHFAADDDYVDFAKKVADAVKDDPKSRGIVLCGSGVGVDIVANKVDGIRCALVQDQMRAIQSREHEDVNMIALPADIVNEDQAFLITKSFLETPFSGVERHERRLQKLAEVEEHHE